MQLYSLLHAGAQALAIAACATFGGHAVAQDIVLRIHHPLPSQAAFATNFITPWAQKVVREAGGRITFSVEAEHLIGVAPISLIDRLNAGACDIAWVPLGAVPTLLPEAEVFEIPFMTSGAETTSRALAAFAEPFLKTRLADYHVIAVHVLGRGILHNGPAAIEKLEDVKDKKIRTPTRTMASFVTALGGVPVGVPDHAVPQALAKGIVDSAAMPWDPTVRLRLADVAKSHTDFEGRMGLYTQTFAFLMRKNAFNSLPPDLQAIIASNSGVQAAGWAGRVADEADVPGIFRARAAANKVLVLDRKETTRWRVRARSIEKAWITTSTERGLDGKALVAEARKLIRRGRGTSQ